MLRKWPSLSPLFCVVICIVIADQFSIPAWLIFLSALSTLLLGLFFYHRNKSVAALITLSLTLGLLSGFHFAIKYIDTGPYHLQNLATGRQTFRIYGQVADWPDLRADRTEIKIALDSLGGRSPASGRIRRVDGAILLKVSDTTTALQRGDRVAFNARIYALKTKEDRDGFDYGRFLNLKGVFGIAYLPTLLDVQVIPRARLGPLSLLDTMRDAIRESLERNLTPRASALAVGFLIGETRDIPTDVYQMFRDSGTVHLLAVSGSNVALILIFISLLLRPFWFRPWLRSIILLSVIVVFAGLSYGEPSVLRASVMASLVIFSRLVGRPVDLNNIIALTGLTILMIEPAQLFDVGFQLSFVTAWGLIIVMPEIAALFRSLLRRRWLRWILFPFFVSLVAQICSTPIIAYYFDRVPVISVMANLVVVPLSSAAVIGLLALLVIDLIWPMLALFFGSLVSLLLDFSVLFLQNIGGEEMPMINTGNLSLGTLGLFLVLALYLLILLGGWSLRHRWARRWLLLSVLVMASALAVSQIVQAEQKPKGSITCFTIPGGVCSIATFTDGNSADLILTSVTGRTYPIDERIIIPELERRGISQIHRIFLLSSDFSAADDVVHLARHFGRPTLYVPAGLMPTFEDQITEADSLSLIGEASSQVASQGEGFYYGGDWLDLRLDARCYRFVVKVDSLVAPTGTGRLLVVGTNRPSAPPDWLALHELGWQQIVCSRIAQFISPSALNPDGESEQLPDFLCSLDRRSYFTLQLGTRRN